MVELQTHYQVKVSRNPLLSDIVWDSGKVAGSTTEVTYPSEGSSLVHGSVYYVKACTWSGDKANELDMASFAINSMPRRPIILEPSSQVVSDELKVSWSQEPDPDGDKLSFFVEVESVLSEEKKEFGPLEGASVTLDPLEIPRAKLLRVRAKSFDGFCFSSWSEWSPDFRMSRSPFTPWFKVPAKGFFSFGSIEAEWEVPDEQQDGVTYLIELVASDGNTTSLGRYGGTKARLSLEGVPEAEGYKLRIIPYSAEGRAGTPCLSDAFPVIREPSISCSASVKGTILLGTNDGRIVSARMPYWNESLSSTSDGEVLKSSSGASASIKFSKDFIELISGPDGHAQIDRRP